MIVWINADTIKEKELGQDMTGIQIEGERPDFVILSEEEAVRAKNNEKIIGYLLSRVLSALKRPSKRNLLVEVNNEIVQFKRY